MGSQRVRHLADTQSAKTEWLSLSYNTCLFLTYFTLYNKNYTSLHITTNDPILFLFMPEQYFIVYTCHGLPRWLTGKESACQCRRHGYYPWVGKILWRREWQHTPVFLPGASHGRRSLAGSSLWGLKRAGRDLVTKTTATYMHQIFLIPSSIDRQSGRFRVFIIANSTTMRPGVHASFRIMVFSRYMSSSGTAGSYQCMYAESRKHGTEEAICRAGSETRT